MKAQGGKGLTHSDREALRVYRSLLKQKQEGTLPEGAALNGVPFRLPRVRLAQDIDLTKAKGSCKSCHGTGIHAHRVLKDDAGEARVPIVCPCVVKAGGVKPDALDRMQGEPS